MRRLWLQQRIIKKRSEGYKAGGFRCYKVDEILLIEVCKPFGNTFKSKIQFDRLKGTYGMLGMIKMIADKYRCASVETFQKLEIIFLHTKDNINSLDSLQQWL